MWPMFLVILRFKTKTMHILKQANKINSPELEMSITRGLIGTCTDNRTMAFLQQHNRPVITMRVDNKSERRYVNVYGKRSIVKMQ